jgi:hypothetical protein
MPSFTYGYNEYMLYDGLKCPFGPNIRPKLGPHMLHYL